MKRLLLETLPSVEGSGHPQTFGARQTGKAYLLQTLLGSQPSFSWLDSRAEIEFIVTNDSGQIVPVEVKNGKRTRARSLQSYIEKCNPHKTIKLTGTQGSSPLEQKNIVMPLYFVRYLPERR